MIAMILMPQKTDHVRLIIPHECITKVETDHMYLDGPDLKHMTAHGIIVHYKDDCWYWDTAGESGPAEGK